MKLGHLLLLSFFITLNGSILQAQWASLGSGITASPRAIGGIAPVDENVIWGFTWHANSFVPTHEFTRTVDGGQTWQAGTLTGVEAGQFPIYIFPLDSQEAWLATADEQDPISGRIYKTIDGGSSWVHQSTGFTGFNETPAGVYFWNENEGFAYGATCAANFDDQIAIYTTADGGENWLKVMAPNMPAQLSGEGLCLWNLAGFFSVVGDSIWFGTNKGRVFRSTDRGVTWAAFSTPLSGSITSVTFKDSQTGLAISYSPLKVARTTNGGDTWDLIPLSAPSSFIGAQIEYIPGTRGTWFMATNSTQYMLSYDDGTHWETINSNINVWAVEFLDSRTGFAGSIISGPAQGGVYKWGGEALGNRLYVKGDATGANNGASWIDAFTGLQDALAAATEGDIIWVAEGFYRPDGPGGSADASFVLDKNVKLYGGFAGTEERLEDRGNPADFPTLLSGDLNGDDVEDNLTMNRTDNVWTVVTVSENITEAAVIDGFTISGGHANGSGANEDPGKSGGGLHALGHPAVRNCHFEQNYAAWRGGGAYFVNTDGLTIENNSFVHNESDNLGGGLNVESDSSKLLAIRECTFTDNAALRGGGLNIQNADCTVEDCTFLYNLTPQHAGGMRYDATAGGQSIELKGSYFEGNASSFGGGFFFEARSDNNSFTISDCRFTENISTNLQPGWGQSGGGAHITDWPNTENNSYLMRDCEFQRNTSTGYGGGLSTFIAGNGSNLEFRNLTFLENSSDAGSGAMDVTSDFATSYGTVLIDSCHFEQNASDFIGGLAVYAGYEDAPSGEYSVTHSTFIANEGREGGALGLWSNEGATANFLVDNCILDGNTADERGGGLLINPHSGDHHVIIKYSHIINNQSPDGGAVEAYIAMANAPFPENASCRIENSLIAGNSSSNAAISMELFPDLELINSTVADNTGGGVELAGLSGLTLQNTILYNPNSPEFTDLLEDAAVTSNGGNLIFDSSLDGWLNNTDQPSTDPMLDAEYHLMQGSPAIDAGVAYEDMPGLDLAGNDRVRGNAVDIGAYESPFMVGAREALAEASIGLAPNPAGAFLKVELPIAAPQAFQAQVMDAQGQLVARRLIRNGELLDVKGLPQGMYLVKAAVDGVVYTGRFVKQ